MRIRLRRYRLIAPGTALTLALLGLSAPGASALAPTAAQTTTPHTAAAHGRTDKPIESGRIRPSGTVTFRTLPHATHRLRSTADPVHTTASRPQPGQQPRRTGLQAVPIKATTEGMHKTQVTPNFLLQDTLFQGAQDPDGATPPDTQVAAGTDDVVEMVNSTMAVTDKHGNAIGSPVELSTFFQAGQTTLPDGSTVNLPTVSDPKIVFNRFSQRFYATELVYDGQTNNSIVKLAASQTADPTGKWYLYNLHYAAGVLEDQPKLGMNLDKLVVTWNNYTGFGNNQSYTGTQTEVLDQAEVDNYGDAIPLDYDLYSDGQDKVFPVVNVDTDPNSSLDAYEVYIHKGGLFNLFTYITVIRVSGSPAQLPRSDRSYSDDVRVAGISAPPAAPQPHSSQKLDTGDERIQSATFRNGTLWAAAGDSCQPSGQPTLACLRVIRLTGANTSSPSGSVDTDLYGPGLYLMYPAITLDDADDVFLTASGSSSGVYPSLGVFSAQSGGTNLSGDLMMTGLGPLSCTPGQDCNNLGQVRYGDYSGISLDGSDPSAVWVAGEYGNAVSTTASATWGTEIGEYNY